MSTVVTCPECQRKLKIAPTSLGKSVKCPCGNVFKAESDAEPALEATPATIVVACDECQTKLKVPASAMGRKMKCSKCGSIFVAGGEGASPPPPRSKAAPPQRSATPQFHQEEQPEEAPRPFKIAPLKPRKAEDEFEVFEEDPAPRSRARSRPVAPAAGTVDAPAGQKKPAATSGCSGCVLNLFVLLLVLAYAAAFGLVVYTDYVELPFGKPPVHHGKLPRIVTPERGDDKGDEAPDKEVPPNAQGEKDNPKAEKTKDDKATDDKGKKNGEAEKDRQSKRDNGERPGVSLTCHRPQAVRKPWRSPPDMMTV